MKRFLIPAVVLVALLIPGSAWAADKPGILDGVAAAAAADGIPTETAFRIPFLYQGKLTPTRAIVVLGPDAKSLLRIAYLAGDVIEEAVYSIARKDKPDPGPDPVPPPPPPPVPGPLHVLFVYDPDKLDDMPFNQVEILGSLPVRQYLAAKCAKEGSQPAFRFLGDRADVSLLTPDWQAVFKRAVENGKGQPWMIVTNGKDAYEGAWPASVAAAIALLQTYGGK